VNPSTALAEVLVDELVRHGVRHAVLCPGSRSAPLAYALQNADRAGRLTLHVRVDERSAGFLALGLAKLTRVPAVVVTTSGTAVANLHPAVLEAHHGVVPLIVLTADRPPELRGTGANQTTVQPGMFGEVVRWSHELGTPTRQPGQQPGWRSVVARAVAAARGVAGDAGPVHLNVPLREPLVPSGDDEWPEPLEGRPGGAPWTAIPSAAERGPVGPDSTLPEPFAAERGPVGPDSPSGVPVLTRGAPDVEPVGRTLVVIGDLPSPGMFDEALAWAVAHGWPVVAEPFGRFPREGVVPHGPLLLSAREWLDDHEPERVVVVGRVTLSRHIANLMRRDGLRVETIAATSSWSDPAGMSSAVHPWAVVHEAVVHADPRVGASAEQGWLSAWREAGERVAKAVAADLNDAAEEAPSPSGPALAGTLLASLPAGATLFVGSSNAARDLDLGSAGSTSPGVTVVASRGLAGIDGCVSTALGIALAGDTPAYALMGDLTFLHDANGLLIGPHEPRPELTVVVTNDDGGGIFTLLEPGEPDLADDFERIFATPIGTDLRALCAAHGVAHQLVLTVQELRQAVGQRPSGIRVLEVPVARDGHRAAHAHLRRIAAESLARG
jgi:2-succinyl-5-enolpyruvyl-6-hydroxy-3-cyclohexene-1-carboxylate synthase